MTEEDGVCQSCGGSGCDRCDATKLKDETFEIISLKEKYWRGQLLEAESNLFKSEGNVRINEMLIKIATEEVDKEAKKNAR